MTGYSKGRTCFLSLFPVVPTHLHLEAHTTPSDPIAGTGSRPQVCKTLDCKWVATTPVSGHLKVEVTVVCGGKSWELADVLKVPEGQAQEKIRSPRVLTSRHKLTHCGNRLMKSQLYRLADPLPVERARTAANRLHRITAATSHRKLCSSSGWGLRMATEGHC